MKEVKEGICFQGDICIMKVDKLPAGLEEVKDAVVAHSETGHHHVAERAKVYKAPDGMTLYMQAIGKTVDVVHKRPYDTHETIRLLGQPGDVFKIKRQREYTPEGWRRVED
ncbi:MAG: hypothetical protein IPJ65_38220 [Archangiaceae bacterium]|nr:hypothetical protein [Archangiaceae bacterium]